MVDHEAGIRQRRFPVEWWLGLFRWPPTARGCGAMAIALIHRYLDE
jgi:hypothetical protein